MKKVAREFKKLILALIVVNILIIISGCCCPDDKKKEIVELKAAGVIVQGCNSPGSIQNTNSFSVRVEKVYYNYDYGPISVWVRLIESQETVEEYIHKQNGFYIYTTNGVKIGSIPPQYPSYQ